MNKPIEICIAIACTHITATHEKDNLGTSD
jgi:hypothetical protein